ncbi:MAG: type II toxin-antitoxin system RelE/ParE family toxin [Candidatus Nealsonbacteria bacterium]|nr:type II toxin-antitoxin system RelE/ParE family toxin [Candidatus Nealsonbacteria bacterium]
MDQPILRVLPEAVEEAQAARQWYEVRSPAAADAFMVELGAAMQRILETPDRFASYLHGTQRCLLHRFPYLVVFRQTERFVDVIAIAHGSRRPAYWKQRSME